MRLNSCWLLVFDLDGTLIDSSLDLCLSVNAALCHVGASELPHSRITSFIGDGAATLIHRALWDAERHEGSGTENAKEDPRFEKAFFHFLAFYREHKLDNTRLYKGVQAALERIRKSRPDLPMAVLTNKPIRPSREICTSLGIAPFFFQIYGGDSFPVKKPDPTGLQQLMAEAQRLYGSAPPLRLAPERAYMVGDSAVDVLTARKAGIQALGCRYGLDREAMELAQPDLLCNSPDEWCLLLDIQE